MSIRHRLKSLLLATMLASAAFATAPAHAQADDALRSFVRDTQSGRAAFTQTVTSPDGARTKTSSGSFEFARPNRFRFTYKKPFEQDIVADGQKVWIYDADLNQVSSRKLSQALGATPAALLAGGSLDGDFTVKSLPDADGLSWVEAFPKAKEASFQSMRVGFRGKVLSTVLITDSFGQRSQLRFTDWVVNPPIDAARFRFTAPAGADVLEQ
jgi:outer membrane lipoprotein carrier protein